MRRHPLLRAARGKGISRRFVAEYYDTADFDLRRAGVGLRLRREGRRVVQTVKLEGRVEGGLHQRPEWETETRDGKLNFAALAQTGWCKHFDDPDLQNRLKPIFTTEFKRTTRIIEPSAGCAIEFCLDQGEIRAQGRVQPICEVEFELKSGEPSALYDIALALDQTIPLRIGRHSKAERGYLLLTAFVAEPVKAAPIELCRDMSVAAAFRHIAFACIAHLEENEAETLAQDNPEYLHQMRVAVRRLRSAFSMFRAALSGAEFEQYADDLRWLGQTLGPARDWDVFNIETLPRIAAQFAAHAGIGQLGKEAARARVDANKAAADAIESRRYQQLLLHLSAWLTALQTMPQEPSADSAVAPATAELATDDFEAGDPTTAALETAGSTLAEIAAPEPIVAEEPITVEEQSAVTTDRIDLSGVREYADSILNKRRKQVKKRGCNLTQLTAAERHQLRIAVKKLRYAIEFFAALYSRKKVKKFSAALTGLQEVLGALNDATVTQTLLSRLPASAAIEHEAAGIVAGYSVAQSHARLASLDQRWNAFRRKKAFW
ncbi:MAG: CYTH and CHAD domain-containing protein [Burkholderiales bacterium]|nr:CYTH and CHAD domain-containing protein [Burkholderiales bacterium]